jgi:low affinity Fe/Cu permease
MLTSELKGCSAMNENQRRHVQLPKVQLESADEFTKHVEEKVQGDSFGRFAAAASARLGSKWATATALLIILVWAATGPVFHYSDTWQLVINTGTTIVTFLMVFLIQNTQNRDSRAINLKLDELIRATDAARNNMLDIESLSDKELETMQLRYKQLRDDCAKDEQASE